MALPLPSDAVKVDPPIGSFTDSLIGLPGEQVVVEQPSGAFTVDVADDNKMKPVPATAVAFTLNAITVAVGQWKQLFVNFSPSYTGDKNLVWTSSDETIATVDKEGVVQSLKDGVATITAAVKSQPTVKATATATCGEGAPAAKVTAAGGVQFSANGTSGWASTIPAGSLVAGSPVSYFVRVNPTGTVAADDGSYDYQFNLVASSAGDTNGAAKGGLTIINDATTQNLAKVSGTVLAAAGENSYELTITGDVVDSYGTTKSGTALKGTWTA